MEPGDKMVAMMQKLLQAILRMTIKITKMLLKAIIRNLWLVLGPVGIGIMGLAILALIVLVSIYGDGGSGGSGTYTPSPNSSSSSGNQSPVVFSGQLNQDQNYQIYSNYQKEAAKYEPSIPGDADQGEVQQFETPWYVLGALDSAKTLTSQSKSGAKTTNDFFPQHGDTTAPILKPSFQFEQFTNGSYTVVTTHRWENVQETVSEGKGRTKTITVLREFTSVSTEDLRKSVDEPTYVDNWDGFHYLTWSQQDTNEPTQTTGSTGAAGDTQVITKTTDYEVRLVRETWKPDWTKFKSAMSAIGLQTDDNEMQTTLAQVLNYSGNPVQPGNFYMQFSDAITSKKVNFVKPFIAPIQYWPVPEKYNEIEGTVGPWLTPYSGTPDFNQGTEIEAPVGTPVYAVAPGTVQLVPTSNTGMSYGNVVQITDSQGNMYQYGFLSKFAVSNGQKVKAGQVIGYTGVTGMGVDLTKPALYFQYLYHTDFSPRNIVAYVTNDPFAAIYSQSYGEYSLNSQGGTQGGIAGGSADCNTQWAQQYRPATHSTPIGMGDNEGRVLPPPPNQIVHWNHSAYDPPSAWIPYYQQAQKTYGVPASIIVALNFQESGFCPYDIAGFGSQAGAAYVPDSPQDWYTHYEWASGLGQFEPTTWISLFQEPGFRAFKSMENQIWNPQLQIMATAYYLQTLGADSNPADLYNALASYNGQTNIEDGMEYKYIYAKQIIFNAQTEYAKYGW